MEYKLQIIAPNGESEIVVGDWPNQRDARKYAVLSSYLWGTCSSRSDFDQADSDWENWETNILEPDALAGEGDRS